jgi:HK97 family phage prohead protease
MIRFEAQPIIIAEASEDSPRTVSGVAVPWEVTATVSDGAAVRFQRGAFDTAAKPAKLLEGHDMTALRGVVTALEDREDGLHFTARFAKTRAADEAIELVKAGAYDAVSVGAVPRKFKFDKDGTMVVSSADLLEISLVAVPAFADAQITEIAASSADPEDDETQPQDTPQEDQVSEEIKAEAPEAPATIPTPLFAEARRPIRLPSPGEYISAMRRGGSEFAQMNANIQAATGDVLVSDAAGVVPTPIVTPIYDNINPLRPVVNALGPKAMPTAGASFIRPYVKVHSSVGAQSNELAGLSTADFEVDDLTVTKKTFGGKLVLSEQVIDWSSPSMLDAAIQDMAGQYALATEKETIDTMTLAITNSQEQVITDITDPEEVIADLYTAAASIASTGNYLPNALVVSPAMWAKIGALCDSTGRPVFPQTAPINGTGTLPGGVTAWNGNPLGLTLVVSNQVGLQTIGNKTATEYMWLLNTRGVEVYEQYKGFLRDESVGTLGVTIAVRGYFAAKVIDVNMIRILGPDATFA